MPEFEVFVAKAKGAFSKDAMMSFKQQNLKKFGGELARLVDGLDPKLTLQLAPHPAGGSTYLPLPNPNNARWTAATGSQAIPRDNSKVKAFIEFLQGLERVFDPAQTGAFEIAEERAPDQDMRFAFATKKFADDHICNVAAKKPLQIRAEAKKVATRRMIRMVPNPAGVGQDVPEFTNIPASSTLDLCQDKNRTEMKGEIDARQKEFEAIYKYLVSEGKRQEILLQGDHEEVMYTTKAKFTFYECARPAQPTDEIEVNKFAECHLRYAVQKVGEKWLLHHMAGKAASGQVNTAPNGQFRAFDYAAHVPGVTAVPGTFTRIG